MPDARALPDGRLWLLRDTYAAETAWAPRHTGKDLRLSRLATIDADLGAIRADAETAAARKAGDHARAARHEHLAASDRALRDFYQQREQAFALPGGSQALILDRLLMRLDITRVGANRATVMCCRRSPLSAVGCCCCCRCRPLILFPVSEISRRRDRTLSGQDSWTGFIRFG